MAMELDSEKRYAQTIDQSLQIAVSRFTGGISPAALTLAFYDWYAHLLVHPAKQHELASLWLEMTSHLINQCACHLTGETSGEFCAISIPSDKRFIADAWQQYPFNFYYESFLMLQHWWNRAATGIHGLSKHHEEVVDFTMRQFIDIFSPSNSPLTNPEVQQAALEQGGENFIRGWKNYLDDLRRYQNNEPPAGSENFVIGENIATAAGKVIFRNHLIELIQYSPTTETVYADPVLITPAWIMKYYILDLTPKHSLVKYLVNKGHTVFMISWKNPREEDSHLGMNDYLKSGTMTALDIISSIIPNKKIHLVGYCLGGTLAAITAAAMARDADQRLASLTLFAAQTDFTEPGELGLFIDESQIAFLESLMKEKGYLDTHQMAGAFQLLRSNDLIWSRMIHDYLLGLRKPLTDLMAWNADATRLPYRMHSEYLRNLFLNNQLAEGNYIVDDKPIALTDISLPMFVVATERDHVSPWRSVFKINLLTTGDVTFTLTSGGHNVGIVSMPTKKTKRYYRISTLKESDRYIDANNWHQSTKPKPGSWWPAWERWLAKHSGKQVTPPQMGSPSTGINPLEDAPGSYVRQK